MNLKQKLNDLLLKKSEQVDLKKNLAAEDKIDSEEFKAAKAEISRLDTEIEEVKALIAEEAAMEGVDLKGLSKNVIHGEGDFAKAVKEMATAVRASFKTMNEGTGSAGGYTVPEDIVTRIYKLREAKKSLRDLVRVTPTKTNKGARTYQTRAQHSGLAKVNEGAAGSQILAPSFGRLVFNIEDYIGFLPITNDLLEDSDENLVNVIMEWFADESNASANHEILDVIHATPEQKFSNLTGIKNALLQQLGAAFRDTAKVITNDDGAAYLADLTDQNGRPLLNPMLTDPSRMVLAAGPFSYELLVYPNSALPTVGVKIPFILGDLREAVELFDRKQLVLTNSGVASVGDLNAFAQNLTIFRGLERKDVVLRDSAAVINGYVDGSAIVECPNLASLKIGSLTLSPAFSKDVVTYTAATTDATNTITATAEDTTATVVIKNGNTTVTSGSAATWEAGENVVTVTVTDGGKSKTYTVTVTKS